MVVEMEGAEVEGIPMRAGSGMTVDLPPPETTATATVTVSVSVTVTVMGVVEMSVVFPLPEMTV